MVYVPVVNTAMAELRFLLEGEKIENTLYFRFPAAITLSNMDALATAIIDWWDNSLRPFLAPQLSLREIYVTNLTTQTSSTHTETTGLPLSGQSLIDTMPGNVAACISLRTANRGRSGRGRNYVSGIPRDQIDGNQLELSFTANVLNAYEAIPTDISTPVGCEHVIVSRFTGGAPRVTGLIQPVTAYLFTSNSVDSQRNRLAERGS